MASKLTLPDEVERLIVVPDVHGDFDRFSAAIGAADDGTHLICLGDIVDRGDFSPLCAELLLDQVARGSMSFVPGNHDVALLEVVAGKRIATPERERTLAQFAEHGGNVLDRFCDAVISAPLAITHGPHAFVHASWSEQMKREGPWSDDLRKLALRGETQIAQGRKRPQVSYKWVERVPMGRVVFVGHDNRGGIAPLHSRSRSGGEVYFMDTGCGSGGPLNIAIVNVESGDVQIEEVST